MRDDLGLDDGEGLRVAEEASDADQQVVEERLNLGRLLLHIGQVVADPLDLVDGHAPLDPADERALLVLREVVAGLGAQRDTDLLDRIDGLGGGGGCRVRRPQAEDVARIGDELRRHGRRLQHIVDHTGGDGAAGHAVVLGALGGLRHGHAALALDGAQAEGAIAAGAREHDADRALVLVLGQRAEQVVDRQAQAARRHRLKQMQGAVEEGHVAVGRDDIGAVGLHDHAVLDLEDLHAGVAPDQLAEDALVVGGEVLNEDEGHVRRGRLGHSGEERLEGGQPAGGRADADDRETRILSEGGSICGGRGGAGRVCHWHGLSCARIPLIIPHAGRSLPLISARHPGRGASPHAV
nr:hypothetical protein [Oscillochloris sp. ZM17-4]